MSILRREPTRELVSLRDAMNRLLEESFVRPFSAFGFEAPLMPVVDVKEKDDAILVKASMAGVKPDDVEITLEGNVLTIKGEVKEEEEEKEEGKFIYREHRYGSFVRSFTLPTEVDADKAKAEFKDGVLYLTLPKKEAAKRRLIKIKK